MACKETSAVSDPVVFGENQQKELRLFRENLHIGKERFCEGGSQQGPPLLLYWHKLHKAPRSDL